VERGGTITGLEAVAGKIGQAVAQRAAKSWLERRRKASERTSTLAELAAQELSSVRQRARLEHLVEGIGHQISDQLEPLLEAKFAALPDNEVKAALNAVVDTLGAVDLSDEAILDADADPEVLARRIRQAVPRPAGLAEQAERLHEIALDQACRYLVQVVRHLPQFQPRALAEVLGRASAQTAQLDEVLARLPRTSLHAPQGTDNDDEFRDEYLRYLANTLDRLELLGLSMRDRPKLALSVAYLSLTVSEQDERAKHDAERWFGAEGGGHGGRARVEAVLTGRTLVRGEAGSGKTTLLDWLAVTAARGQFTDQLVEWNGLVPLPIRLRRYADSPLPRPEQLLDQAASWLAGLMPEGWVHRCLRSGRALVLLDGVDEVPANKRRVVRDWLHELVTAFPKTTVVVTARPAAADERWLADEGFTSVLLEQMSPDDVRMFLSRWHEAAAGADSLPCPVDQLPVAERRLLGQLDNRSHLRALAANPLLCAMLCALNLGRTSELPQNRMDLYHAALAMLLDLRDAEREIAGLLTATEKTVLLRDLAWRLTLGGRSQLPTAKVREHVARKVRAMPSTDADPDTIVTHLLERSGVVREPVPGQVDFVHRTFQEYLAAAEATQDGQIEALVGHAHLDAWRETIVMACGHAQRTQVGELLTDILDRADREPTYARRLRLLAAACLETVTDLDPEVNDRVDQVIRDRLVPPKSVRETGSLASVGHRVLRYLPTTLEGLSESVAAATVRTAALTATPEAMTRLARYAADGRHQVQRQLAKAWQYFDPERYAKEVLADAPLDNGYIMVESRRLLPHLPELRHRSLVSIWLPNSDPRTDLDFITDVEHLWMLRFPGQGEVDLRPLHGHPKLAHLYLDHADHLTHLDTLGDLDDLKTLRLSQGRELPDLEFLTRLTDLTRLSLPRVAAPSDFAVLGTLTELRDLSITSWPHDLDLSLLRLMPSLTELQLGGDSSPNSLQGIHHHAPRLVMLFLIGELVSGLRHIVELAELERLVLIGSTDLTPLRDKSLTLQLMRHGNYVGLDQLGPGVKVKYF
jgi:hypothetical protein